VAYHLSEPALAPCDIPAKNRVWGFFPLSSRTRLAIRRQSPQPRRKNSPTPTKTVSGIPYWPSRDPIGENSFFVQYVRGQSRLQIQILTEMSKKPAYLFAANDGVNNSDFLGLAYFAYRPLTGVLSGLGVCGNSADDACNTYIAHEQLFFEDKKTPPNQGFFDDSTVREDRAENLGNYQAAHDSGWNDCVMRKAVAAVPAGTYCLLGAIGSTEKNNCQDWAEAVRQKYKSLIKDANTVSECCPTQAEKNK